MQWWESHEPSEAAIQCDKHAALVCANLKQRAIVGTGKLLREHSRYIMTGVAQKLGATGPDILVQFDAHEISAWASRDDAVPSGLRAISNGRANIIS